MKLVRCNGWSIRISLYKWSKIFNLNLATFVTKRAATADQSDLCFVRLLSWRCREFASWCFVAFSLCGQLILLLIWHASAQLSGVLATYQDQLAGLTYHWLDGCLGSIKSVAPILYAKRTTLPNRFVELRPRTTNVTIRLPHSLCFRTLWSSEFKESLKVHKIVS